MGFIKILEGTYNTLQKLDIVYISTVSYIPSQKRNMIFENFTPFWGQFTRFPIPPFVAYQIAEK